MDVLEHLTLEERQLITALPYRAGLWVSMSDQTGGDEAADKELTALSNIITGFSSQVFGSELLQYIMNETLKQQAQWPEWSENIENVPNECAKALDILRMHVGDKEVNAFSIRIMEIGEAVALAFREYEQYRLGDQLAIYCSYISSAMKACFKKGPSKSFDQYLSVSISERKALGALAKAMGAQITV